MQDIEQASRVRVRWHVTEAVPRNQVKLAFLALLCCESAMPMGGEVEVTSDGDKWMVSGSADRMNVDADLWKNVSTGGFANKVTPAQVQFALLPQTAASMGRRVAVETGATRVALRF